MEKQKLKEIKGRRIRPLFLNYISFTMLLIFIFIDIICLVEYTQNGFYDQKLVGDILKLTAFLFILIQGNNMLNRRFIGPLTGVMNKEGIYGKDFMLPWERIQRVEFETHGYGKKTNELILHSDGKVYVIKYASLWDIGYIKRRAKKAKCVSYSYNLLFISMIVYVILAIQVLVTHFV